VDRMSLLDPAKGLTLVELMIVLVVLAATLSIGAPSMQNMLHKNRVRSESSRLLTAINLARSEAVMRNLPVSLCPSAMALTGEPVCSGVYSGGWIVFSNADKDRVVDAGTDEVLKVFEGLPRGYTLTNRAGTRAALELINYLPDGSSHRNRTLLLCSPAGGSMHALSIVINIVGRPRLARDWGECPAT
jgi:type IV fimbrial biogenesis protein FimT